eukprot:SAG31_NODE_4205_length_3474_cov_8.209481_1_plen_65_part_10
MSHDLVIEGSQYQRWVRAAENGATTTETPSRRLLRCSQLPNHHETWYALLIWCSLHFINLASAHY